MPEFTIQVPDGRHVTVEANSQQDAMTGVQQWYAANPKPPPPPPRKPWVDREVAAGKILLGDINPLDLKNWVEATQPGGPIRKAGQVGMDVWQPIAELVGGGVEHVQRTAERKLGAPQPVQEPGWAEAAINPGQAVGSFLWNAIAGLSPEQRAKGAGDIGSTLAAPPAMEGLIAGKEALAVTTLMREAGVSRPVAIAMLKAGTPYKVPIKEPGILERVAGGAKTAYKAARGRQDVDRVLTDEERAAEAKRGEATVRRVVARLDPTGKKLSENAVEAAGKPITAGEALGVKGRAHQRISATRGGQGGDVLQEQLRQRTAGAPQRVTQDFADATGLLPEEVEGDFDAAMEKRREALDPQYKAAHAEDVIESEKMRQLYSRPTMQEALKVAYKMMKDRGLEPEELGLQMKTSQVVSTPKGRQRVPGPEYVEVRTPNAQTLDYVKRALRKIVKSHIGQDGKLDDVGQGLQVLLKEFRDEIYEANPKLKAAAADAGDVLRQEEAFDNPKKLFGPETTDTAFRKAVGKMTPSERRATLAGMLRDVRQEAGKTRFPLAKFLGPDYKRRVEFLMDALNPEDGAAKTKALFDRIEMEAQLQRNAGRIAPETGSVTSQAMLTVSEQNELAAELAKAAPKLLMGKKGWIETATDVAGNLVKGSIEGARVPLDEAAHDEITRLLSMKPSEAYKYLQDRKMNPPTISKIMRIVNKARARKWGLLLGTGTAARELMQGQQGQ